MITLKTLGITTVIGALSVWLVPFVSIEDNEIVIADISICTTPKGCVFRTIFGEESSDSSFIYQTPEHVENAIQNGLAWIAKAQQSNGGWGAGSHSYQQEINPHAVNTDPATTAMVGMALLRTGSTFSSGEYSRQLNEALDYLLEAVESTPDDRLTITSETNTQIQSKLGQNIDAVMALQFFSNAMDYLDGDNQLKRRVKASMNSCAKKVQKLQDQNGSFKGSGWAGVLQSAMANNALESAQYQGGEVDDDVLEKSREYQKSNYDAESGNVNTTKGAGVVLYSVSGSVRASAKEARKVREEVQKAKKRGILSQNAPITPDNLEQIGYSKDEALRYSTSYKVYESSKTTAQDDAVMTGFGNNGGEEFLSYLQTGESLIINQDEEWKKWYGNISGRLINIQNQDGSWNGHHCITSPVFCTATTLLTLSINNDIDKLVAMGSE